jgi:hypothetical protein
MLSNGHNRHESMIMDMDVLAESEPVSRIASRSPSPVNGNVLVPAAEEQKVDAAPEPEAVSPVEEKPKKMGNLMKELKQDVTQGAMEFSMDSFF